eukprot:68822_1
MSSRSQRTTRNSSSPNMSQDTLEIRDGCSKSTNPGQLCVLNYYLSNPPVSCDDCNYNTVSYYFFCHKHNAIICDLCADKFKEDTNASPKSTHDEDYLPPDSDLNSILSYENTNSKAEDQIQTRKRSLSNERRKLDNKRRKLDIDDDVAVFRQDNQIFMDQMIDKYKQTLIQNDNYYAGKIQQKRNECEKLIQKLERRDNEIISLKSEIYGYSTMINSEQRKYEQLEMNHKQQQDALKNKLSYETNEKQDLQWKYKMYKEQKENELNEFKQGLVDVKIEYRINMERKEKELEQYIRDIEEKDKELNKLKEQNVDIEEKDKKLNKLKAAMQKNALDNEYLKM